MNKDIEDIVGRLSGVGITLDRIRNDLRSLAEGEVQSTEPEPIYLPRDIGNELTKEYGKPGSESNLTWVDFPFQRYLWVRGGPPLTDHNNNEFCDHRAHYQVAQSLQAAWDEIAATISQNEIHRMGLQVFGGIYNNRRKKGGSEWSTHAWGIAEDINPAENPYGKDQRTISDQVFDIFEKHGWLSGGRAWNHDWMHIQRAIPSLIKPSSYYGQNGLPKRIKYKY